MARRIIVVITGLIVSVIAFATPAAAATGTTTDAAGVARARIGESLTRQADVPWLLLATLIVAVGATLIAGRRSLPQAAVHSIRPPKVR